MDEFLIEHNDVLYYLDIDAIGEYVKITPPALPKPKNKINENLDVNFDTTNMVNVTKYEMIKMMVDVTFGLGFSPEDDSDLDETERLIKGMQSNSSLTKLSLPFKIAFNTLIINKIIKTYEPTIRKNKRGNSETKK